MMMKWICRIAPNSLRAASSGFIAPCPGHTVAQVLGKQVLRSGTSVGANYREAHRGRSKAEFVPDRRFLERSDETLYWLELFV